MAVSTGSGTWRNTFSPSSNRRRRASGESGLTLIEMMVVLGILGIVLATLTTGVITLYQASSTVDFGTQNQNQARTAIAVISRDIRAASPVRPSTDPAFLVARPDEASFTANLDDSIRPKLVRLWIDSESRMIEDATPADPDGDPADGLVWNVADDAVIRYIAAFVVNDVTVPVFRYLDGEGDELPYSDDPCPGPSGSVPPPCLDLAARREIAIVEVNMSVSSSPSRAARFTVSQRVRLPNAF